MAELKFQSQCFQWHWNTYPEERQMLFHVQNKAANAIEGNKFKAMGVVKGVSDLIYISKFQTYFIELKDEKGYQSKEQIEFQKKVLLRGHVYVVVRSLDEFKKVINEAQSYTGLSFFFARIKSFLGSL